MSQDNHLSNKAGQKLYCKYWNENKDTGLDATDSTLTTGNNSSIKGLVFISHGYCEHCQCYSDLAACLVAKGLFVFSHDHVGHGLSEGERASIQDFSQYVEDVFLHVDSIKQMIPDRPVFIIGHSMGGAIAILAAMERPLYFKGVILIGPLIIPDKKAVNPVKIFLGKLLARIKPQMHIAAIESAAISRDQNSVNEYTKDPLVYHDGVKCGWGLAMLSALQKIQENMKSIAWPFLVLHGTKDGLCEVEGAQLLYDQAMSTDKQIKLFEGAFHQLHKEIEPVKTETVSAIVDWLMMRV